MKSTLRQAVVEHLGEQSLSDAQFARLEKLQQTHERRRGKTVLGYALTAVVAFIVATIATLSLIPQDRAATIAAEVVANHLKREPLEIKGTALADIRGHFQGLGFALVESTLADISATTLVGGRYCSVRGVAAAQLRLKDAEQRFETLYQVRYDADRFGVMPMIENGDKPLHLMAQGLDVDLWVEKGVLFARIRE